MSKDSCVSRWVKTNPNDVCPSHATFQCQTPELARKKNTRNLPIPQRRKRLRKPQRAGPLRLFWGTQESMIDWGSNSLKLTANSLPLKKYICHLRRKLPETTITVYAQKIRHLKRKLHLPTIDFSGASWGVYPKLGKHSIAICKYQSYQRIKESREMRYLFLKIDVNIGSIVKTRTSWWFLCGFYPLET